MAFESQSLKKSSSTGVFGDVLYGTMMFPKELEIDKESNFELGFQVPDLGCVLKVSGRSLSLFFSFFTFYVIVNDFCLVAGRITGNFVKRN